MNEDRCKIGQTQGHNGADDTCTQSDHKRSQIRHTPADTKTTATQPDETHTGPRPGRQYTFTVGVQASMNMEADQSSPGHSQ